MMDKGFRRRKSIRRVLPVEEVSPVQTEIPQKNEPPLKASDLLSFFSGIVALSLGAIFYISGWVYEANWYSFYGIQLSQVDLSTQQIMIDGVPGIFILIVSGILVLTGMAIVRSFKGLAIASDDLPTLAILTDLLVSFVLIIFIIRLLFMGLPVPREAIISGLTIPLIAFIILIVFQLTNVAQTVVDGGLSAIPNKIDLALLVPITLPLTGVKNLVRSYLLNYVENQRIKVVRSISETGRFWLILVLLTAFFISIAISAMMGVMNAHFGSRMMMGNWQMSPIYLYSDTYIEPLPTTMSSKTYLYGPLGLLAVSDKSYYLVDWNSKREYDWHPPLYVVPRSENEVLVFKAPTPTMPPETSTPTRAAQESPNALTPTP